MNLTAEWKVTYRIVPVEFQSKSSEEVRKERRAAIDAQSVFTKLKAKKISPKTKKAVARQSLHNIVTHSQKNFSNFKNSFGGQKLGIVHKRVTAERESERIENEPEELEKELETSEKVSEKLEKESEELGVNTSVDCSEAAASSANSKEATSSASETSRKTVSQVGKAQCLVSYDMSTSDSDESGQ